MPVKKTGKKDSGSSGTGSSGKAKTKWVPTVPSEDPILPRGPPERLIAVQVRCVTWRVMDFTLRMLAEKPVVDVVAQIQERHGGAINVADLSLYRDEVHPRNLLIDLSQSLADLLPEPRDASEVRAEALTFRYDFKPIATDCAIALCAPNNFKIEGTLAEERAEKAKLAAVATGSTRGRASQPQQDMTASRASLESGGSGSTFGGNRRINNMASTREDSHSPSRRGISYLPPAILSRAR